MLLLFDNLMSLSALIKISPASPSLELLVEIRESLLNAKEPVVMLISLHHLLLVNQNLSPIEATISQLSIVTDSPV